MFKNPKKDISMTALGDLLKEAYEVGMLSEADQAKYNLICRYKNKVSQRLLDEQKELRNEGRELFSEFMGAVLDRPNPFLDFIKKDMSSGGSCPIPVIVGTEHGVEFSTKDKK